MPRATAEHDLAVSAIDLTRACSEHELYLAWLQLHSPVLNGSAAVANYLFFAALAFEEPAHPVAGPDFDAFVARENLADLLMASAPLSSDEFREAVALAIQEAADENAPLHVAIAVRIPETHPKFEGLPLEPVRKRNGKPN